MCPNFILWSNKHVANVLTHRKVLCMWQLFGLHQTLDSLHTSPYVLAPGLSLRRFLVVQAFVKM